MMTSAAAKKILVIEDETAQRNALSEKLSEEGYQVQVARDGEEGLRLALAEKPDLILLDIVMPNMDGVSVLKQLRQDEWGKIVPVIMLTNLSEAHVALEGEDFQAYLVKADWKLSDLVNEVQKLLR